MRLASYNQMFGCDGRSLTEFTTVHGLHYAKAYEKVERRADLGKTAGTILEADADIVGVAEVLGERQRDKLIATLSDQGYSHFHVGTGHGLGQKYNGAIETLIATRMPSTPFYDPKFAVPERLGYGGGVIGIHVPSHDMYVVQVHFPIVKANLDQQIQGVLAEAERLTRDAAESKVVIMGDFNQTHADLLRLHPEFAKFARLSPGMATCSTTNLVRWFYRKDLDHILGHNLEAKNSGLIEGISDHKLVWVEV